jgi:Haem-binding uptake, Tiki superfamily, ChaN
MATSSTLGERRNAAQLRALAGVEREVRANDTSCRRKYLRDFRNAFQSYQKIIDADELATTVNRADIILVGDYHALPAAQKYAAGLLEQRAQVGDRPVVLGVESIFSRHQHVLDEWWRREIGPQELQERLRFDSDWGYDWLPFYELLVTGREHADAIYGLDCLPREDLRKIAARDRHAVEKIEEIRRSHPRAVIIVLFGESHLAPHHLPQLLRQRMPEQQVLTILQNVDALYWAATSELIQPVDAVKVNDDVMCVFNSTPLEKYESYRLYLTRWQGISSQPDAAPTIYNLIDSLACFLDINRYSSHNTTQPKFLVDLLPEVYCSLSDTRLRQLLQRAVDDPQQIESLLKKIESRGCVYLTSLNTLYVHDFQMMYTAEEVARFLHHACRGLPYRREPKPSSSERQDIFYTRMLENALGYFGARVLYPPRPVLGEQMDISTKMCAKLAQDAVAGVPTEFDDRAINLGYRLGNELYDAYLRGAVSRTVLRRLFLAHLTAPGAARQVCSEILRRIRLTAKKPCASVR